MQIAMEQVRLVNDKSNEVMYKTTMSLQITKKLICDIAMERIFNILVDKNYQALMWNKLKYFLFKFKI